MDSYFEKVNANVEEMRATMDAYYEKMDARYEKRMAIMDAYYEGTIAIIKECLGRPEAKKEPTPKEPEAVAESREVPKGGTDEETSRGTVDRSGEQRQAVRRHRQRKERAQGNGGPRRKFATVRGRFTRRAVPALRKGHVRKGPGRTLGGRMTDRGLKKRRTEVSVVRGTPKGRTSEERRRTRPECNSGIRRLSKTSGNRMRGWTGKRDQRLDAKGTHREVIRKSLDLEIAMLIVQSPIGLQEPGDEFLWTCRPPPKRKR
jgi:hypothetical protein